MQATLGQSNHPRSTLVSLGQNHGYRFEGDTAILNAELALGQLPDQDDSSAQGEHWALQLWACETPHQGGPLRGIKVAEAALALPRPGAHDYLEASAFAQLPPAQRDYSMVLVLASGSAGSYDQVHDFSNYPARQQFAAPHLEGSVGYRIEGDVLVLQAEGVRNPRAADNLSGSLSLQLWALCEPYAGGAFEGVLLGSAELDRLAGQHEERAVERRVALAEAPAGEWQLALMLREWTEAAGYLTRDFCNFASPYRAEPTDPGSLAEAARPATDGEVGTVETFAAQAHAELVRDESVAKRDEESPGAAHADAERLAATQRAEDAAREADAAARAAASARAEKAAREAELAERAIAAARAAEAAERETAARAEELRASTAQAEAEARAAMAVRAGKPAAAAKATRAESSSQAVKSALGAPASGAKKATAQAPAAKVDTRAEGPRPATGARVSVQTASVDELAGVPGLNKKLAAAIVRARPFASLDDLRQVRGIGDKMLQQLRGALTL